MEKNDAILDKFSESSEVLMDLVDTNDNYAMLALCVRYQEETPGQEAFVETNIAANGFFGVLEEGLYSELLDQVRGGNMKLFAAIRSAIRDIEGEIGITAYEDINVEEDNEQIIH